MLVQRDNLLAALRGAEENIRQLRVAEFDNAALVERLQAEINELKHKQGGESPIKELRKEQFFNTVLLATFLMRNTFSVPFPSHLCYLNASRSRVAGWLTPCIDQLVDNAELNSNRGMTTEQQMANLTEWMDSFGDRLIWQTIRLLFNSSMTVAATMVVNFNKLATN